MNGSSFTKNFLTLSGTLILLTAIATGVNQVQKQQATKTEAQVSCTHYVSTSGSDSNSGTSTGSPWGTIQNGVNSVGAGDVLCIRGGNYYEDINIRNSGTASNPLTVSAYPGERPVIDGRAGVDCLNCGIPTLLNGRTDPVSGKTFSYNPLVSIEGNYIHLEGFSITRSMGRCIRIWNGNFQVTGTVVRNNVIHDCRNSGIVLINRPQNTLIEGNDVSMTGSYATYSRGAGSLDWPAAVGDIFARNTTMRGNIIHENWGEGIIIGRDSIGAVFEGNTVYDNYAVQLYVHSTSNVVVQRNLFYHTQNPEFFRGGHPSACIVVTSAEPQWGSGNTVNVQVINNMATGCSNNMAFWGGVGEIRDVTVASNTFVNAYDPRDTPIGVRVGYGNLGNMYNILIANNLTLQDSGDLIREYGQSGVTYQNNLWSRAGYSSRASSSGDVVGDPQLLSPNQSIGRGTVSATWYTLTESSPAISAASTIANVPGDYFGNSRDAQPDIGAHEFGGIIALPTTPPGSTPAPFPIVIPNLSALPPGCYCSIFLDMGCGTDPCTSPEERYLVRTCFPAGCSEEEECYQDSLCTYTPPSSEPTVVPPPSDDAAPDPAIYCDETGNPVIENTGKLYTAIGCIPVDNLNNFAGFILPWALSISGGIALILIVYAGIQITTSQGDIERLQSGKKLLTAAIAGLVLIILSAFILRLIGVDLFGIPGFGQQ